MKKLLLLLFIASPGMAASYNTVTITATATQIMGKGRARGAWVIHNTSTSTVFIGTDSSVTAANGVPILGNEKIMNEGNFIWNGTVFGICPASEGANIRFLEWGQSDAQ